MSVGALSSYQSVVLAGASLGTSVLFSPPDTRDRQLGADWRGGEGIQEPEAGSVSGPVSVVLFLSLPAPLLCTALPLSVC